MLSPVSRAQARGAYPDYQGLVGAHRSHKGPRREYWDLSGLIGVPSSPIIRKRDKGGSSHQFDPESHEQSLMKLDMGAH